MARVPWGLSHLHGTLENVLTSAPWLHLRLPRIRLQARSPTATSQQRLPETNFWPRFLLFFIVISSPENERSLVEPCGEAAEVWLWGDLLHSVSSPGKSWVTRPQTWGRLSPLGTDGQRLSPGKGDVSSCLPGDAGCAVPSMPSGGTSFWVPKSGDTHDWNINIGASGHQIWR